MKMYSKEGIEMMDVQSISRDKDDLVIKGKMMGSMHTAIYVKPEDVWGALRLMPLRVVLAMPVLLFRGLIRSRKSGNP